jgi:tetratricopeptide (TPR) repeat protein
VSRRRPRGRLVLASHAGLAALLVAAAGCGGRTDHERLGDRAYGEARYPDAVAEYREAVGSAPSATRWAKLGAAALHAGELRQSAEAYVRLAGDDPTRRVEAAEGLEGVARVAEREGNFDVLQEVVTGLQAIAPERGTGRYALTLAQAPHPDTADLVALLPAALAAASAPETVDSLLMAYGRAVQVTAGCGQALLLFRAVLRRSQDSGTRAPARQGAADCAFALGERADSAGRLQDAVLWFAEAARVDSTTPTGRRALLRYGAGRLKQGDTLAAAMAFQTVVSGGTADSTGEAAASRLAALGMTTPVGDSAGTGER